MLNVFVLKYEDNFHTYTLFVFIMEYLGYLMFTLKMGICPITPRKYDKLIGDWMDMQLFHYGEGNKLNISLMMSFFLPASVFL